MVTGPLVQHPLLLTIEPIFDNAEQMIGAKRLLDNLRYGLYIKCSGCACFGTCDTITMQGSDILCSECAR